MEYKGKDEATEKAAMNGEREEPASQEWGKKTVFIKGVVRTPREGWIVQSGGNQDHEKF